MHNFISKKNLLINFVILTAFNSILSAQNIKNKKGTNDSIKRNIEINEIIINSRNKKQHADKSVYTFQKQALEKARYAKDLLISLPELKLDPISNSIVSIKNDKILFLINGIETTDLQIRSTKPENVIKIEYYDIPPARFANRSDIVVNIITRNPENGYVFGFDANTALSTGFINGSAYTTITKKNQDFGLEYNINSRNYNNRISNKRYQYSLNNLDYTSDEIQKDHFGYTDQQIALRYTNIINENQSFQAKINLNIQDSFSEANGNSQFIIFNTSENHNSLHNKKASFIAPTLDLYYSKKIGKKDEFNLNFISTFYNTQSYQFDKEWVQNTGTSIFDNDMILTAKQNGWIGEIAHTHQFKKAKLSSGYRIKNTSISNDLQNLLGNFQYNVNYFEQYVYTEYAEKINQFNYRLGIGITNFQNKSSETIFKETTFTPKVVVGYNLKSNLTLRITSAYTPKSPTAETLSKNIVQVVPNIIKKGNPFLVAQHNWNTALGLNYNNKYFDFSTSLIYNYIDKPINQFYSLNNNTNYALTYENAQNFKLTSLQFTGSIKPFGNDKLSLKIVLKPTTEIMILNSESKITNSYFGNYFEINSKIKKFSIQYQFNIPTYTLGGAFLNTNENTNHLFLNYTLKNWSLYSGVYWLGFPANYKSKSIDQSPVTYTSDINIHNNKNMFTLGISYDFATGKKNEMNKKINNTTAPAATF